MKALMKKHAALVQIKDEDLVKRFSELTAGYNSLKDAIKKREAERPSPLPQIAVLTEPAGEPPQHHLLVRGIYANEGSEVPPGVPSVFCTVGNSYQLTSNPKNSGRRLAHWTVKPRNAEPRI